jgi:hypothetical protein
MRKVVILTAYARHNNIHASLPTLVLCQLWHTTDHAEDERGE